MMWFLFPLVYSALTELVVLTGAQDKQRPMMILKGGDGPCDGHVEVFHENKWGYVGDTNWNKNTEQVVCRSTHCGSPVEDSTKDVLMKDNRPVWLNEMRCNGNEEELLNCEYPGPGWNISTYRKETVKKIECSNKIKIDLDGFKCAGAVQYSTDGKEQSGYFCAEKWGKEEADFLCNTMGCGKSINSTVYPWTIRKEFETLKNMMVDCSNIKIENLWQCIAGESSSCKSPAFVICEGYQRLQLKGDPSNVCSGRLEMQKNNLWVPYEKNIDSPDVLCQQLNCGSQGSFDNNSKWLTCTDNVNVVLIDGGKKSKCYGEVHINVSGSNHPVCASEWTRTGAQVVCKELNCGKVVALSVRGPKNGGAMDNVQCSGNESSLWHCPATRNNKVIQCTSTAYVVCTGSTAVRLTDGPGKCSGRVEIRYEGAWRQVDDNGWTKANSDTVCRQLKCMKLRKTEEFIQGSGGFLNKNVTCMAKSSTISKCFIGESRNQRTEKKAVGLICEDHKVVFLKGNDRCSGMVGIEKGNDTYWLSGSSKTWNRESADIVCRQMNCEKASNFSNSIRNASMKTWAKAYTCSSNNKSLFECGITEPPSDHNETIATVICEGKVQINLTNTCWGKVNISLGKRWGDVCADTWTNEHSVKLCERLSCGDKVLKATKNSGESQVMIKSLHSTKQGTNLTDYTFVLNDDNDTTCNKKPAYVVCSGSVKPRFSISRDKCSGNLEVYIEGAWIPVCRDALQDKEVQSILCEEMGCGQAVDVIDYFGPKPTGTYAISKLQCSTKSLKECEITPAATECIPTGLQCTNMRKIKVSEGCSGAVSVHSNGTNHAVSNENWTEIEGQRLCQDLQCGSYMSKEVNNKLETSLFWSSKFSCSPESIPENIWDCEQQNSSPTKQQLFIKCQGEPNVTLSEKCGGLVRIEGKEICNTNWKYSDLICQEQGCSNAVVTLSTKPNPNAEYYHVSCEDYHHKLSQCKRFKGKCNGDLVSVYCVGNVNFTTNEICGGQIKVNYGNGWKNICPLKLTNKFLDKLCQELGCGDVQSIPTGTPSQRVEYKTSLECTNNHLDIKHCTIDKSCLSTSPAEIRCKGYIPSTAPPPLEYENHIVSISAGVGSFLVLVILIIIFVRIYIVTKAKNVMNIPSRMLSRKEVEFESGDYEDVSSKANEMEDFSRGRFRSEDEFLTENDARSNSSFPYDDIDEAVEGQPLTSQAATAGASRDSYIQEGAHAPSDDGVTYEVDDPQENYDDIEASHEITQTKAEVHDGPKTTPESNAGAPPDLVQGDEDYLVPGQEG